MNKTRPRPTGAELAILRVLWRRGPSTVRQVHEAIRSDRGTGYTTALKLLQIMVAKGLARRDASGRSHVYAAACDQAATQRRLVGDLLDRVFDGSARQLVLQALEARRVPPEELQEIRRLIDRMEGGRR